jgi:transposase
MGIVLVKEIQRRKYIDGLKDRPKSGRPPDIPEETVYEIKNELASNRQQGWTTKQVEDLIVRKRKWWNQISLYSPYTDSCTNGDSNRRYQEKYM